MYNASGATGRGTIALFADFPEANNYNPWASGWVDGTDLSNSQCTLKGSLMSKVTSGSDLLVTIPIVATNLMVGTYSIYINYGNGWNFSSPNGYWQPIATLPPPPTSSVLPASGQGFSTAFDVKLTSAGPGKSRAISRSLFFVNQYFSGVGACYAIYYNTSRKLILLSDDGNNVVANGQTFLTPTPRSSQMAQSSQCSMDLGQVTYADPGTNDVTLHFPITFMPNFATVGPQSKGVYSFPIDRANQTPGTSPVGAWVVPIPDYSITVAPASGAITYAGSNLPVTYNVNVTPINGFSGKVTLAGSGFPGGAKVTFDPPEISPGTASVMTINPIHIKSAGNFTVVVSGQSGLIFRAAQGSQLAVQDFAIDVTPVYSAISLPMSTNVTQSYTLSATGVNGFNLPINSSLIPNGCS